MSRDARPATSTSCARCSCSRSSTTSSCSGCASTGHVQRFEPGWIDARGRAGDLLLRPDRGRDRAVAPGRRDDVEISRTDQRGVYAGAWPAYLGDRVAADLPQLDLRASTPHPVVRARRRRLRRAHARVVPDGRCTCSKACSSASRTHQRRVAPARAAARARLAVGRPHPRAEQPGRGGRAGHVVAARPGRRTCGRS